MSLCTASIGQWNETVFSVKIHGLTTKKTQHLLSWVSQDREACIEYEDRFRLTENPFDDNFFNRIQGNVT